MSKSLSGAKIAMLIANGFHQDEMIGLQKSLTSHEASVRIVSPENGLVNGWDGKGWGHHFAVDVPLSTSLGADYSALVVPGGQRSIEKLNLTAHTKRFINSFMDSEKPVVVLNNAANILILADQIRGRSVCAPDQLKDAIEQAGGHWIDAPYHSDNNLMTIMTDKLGMEAMPEKVISGLTNQKNVVQAA